MSESNESLSEIRIRAEQESDLPQIRELLAQLGYPAKDEELAERMNQLGEHADYRVKVAERSGRLLGLIALHRELPLLRGKPEVQVMALVVSEDSRGSGIGRLLLRKAEEWAKEIDAFCVRLNSGNREERMAAHRFYVHQGYTASSTGFFLKIEDQK